MASVGFPSPADDYEEQRLSLDDHLIKREPSTFFLRAKGSLGAVREGDLLIVDRAEKPEDESIVIAALDGELRLKRYRGGSRPHLVGHEGRKVEVWGVVQYVIHRVP